MITDKIKLALPVIVEGKYDKIALSTVADAHIVTTDGFGIFNSREKRALISRISENGIIVLCDSDSAGGMIRAHLAGIVPKERLYQLYVPCIKGKERRKQSPSKEGLLGVEGMSTEILRERLLSLAEVHPEILGGDALPREEITAADMYGAGLSGGENAAEKRDRVAVAAGLPKGMTQKALRAALGTIMTREQFFELVSSERTSDNDK